MFLHGTPADHMDMNMLYDVLRSLSLGTYDVPFLHLNAKRLAQMQLEPCVQELLRPALRASGTTANAAPPVVLPAAMSTYCCSQFVVSRERLAAVPALFWDEVWQAFLRGGEAAAAGGGADVAAGLKAMLAAMPAACHRTTRRVHQAHQRLGSTKAAGPWVWGVALERTWHWIFGEDACLPVREEDPRLPLFLRTSRPRTTLEGGPRGALHDVVTMPDWGYDPGWWGSDRSLANVTGVPMVESAVPVPTSLFTAVARENWRLPDWIEAWFREEPPDPLGTLVSPKS